MGYHSEHTVNLLQSSESGSHIELQLTVARQQSWEQLSTTSAGPPVRLTMVSTIHGWLQEKDGPRLAPNRALSVEIMEELLKAVEGKALTATDEESRQKWVMGGAYFCVCFVLSLRSAEGLLADLEGTIAHYDEERPDVVIPLLVRFKGEDHLSQHRMPCVSTTESSIQVKSWRRFTGPRVGLRGQCF